VKLESRAFVVIDMSPATVSSLSKPENPVSVSAFVMVSVPPIDVRLEKPWRFGSRPAGVDRQRIADRAQLVEIERRQLGKGDQIDVTAGEDEVRHRDRLERRVVVDQQAAGREQVWRIHRGQFAVALELHEVAELGECGELEGREPGVRVDQDANVDFLEPGECDSMGGVALPLISMRATERR